MTKAAPQPHRTVVVMLGGSAYPNHPAFDNPRFKRSAEGLRAYFEDPARFGLPKDQLLWLFDSTKSPTDLDNAIERFLTEAMARADDARPLDVIVCFIGHGFFDDARSYYLATASYKPGVPDYSYRFRFLQDTIKKTMRFARKFYLLDACYSASAARELMGTPVAQRVLGEVEAAAAGDLPERGTAVLCAASSDDEAVAPDSETQTMFTGALLSVLADPGVETDALSLKQVHVLVDDLIRKRFGVKAVHPEIHVPDQRQGDVGGLPLFPVRRPATDETAGVLDAFEAGTFADDSLLHAVVVCRGGSRNHLPSLVQAVSDAWIKSNSEITAAADLCRKTWLKPPIPSDREDGGFVLAHLAVERAFESTDSLQRAIAALCRAEIAVFDLTDWDHSATFLLGVRAVARRGVTITSIGGEFTIGSALAVPFNLQLLSLASHSKDQKKKGAGLKPSDVIGGKIVNGLRDLATLPHYLDLPAYDSVRQLGVESGAYRTVQMRERILMLCPFGPEYTEGNWDRLETVLPSRVQAHINKTEKKTVDPPALVRLLDLQTPRLVAQTLFESIRLTDMCVVDWTGLRVNVIFEAGVRMATNPLGAVHVIEAGDLKRLRDGADPQAHDMLKLFDPLPYPLSGVSTKPFDRMVQRFEESVGASADGVTNPVYAAAGVALDRRSQPAALPLANELIRSANLLFTDDQESVGISPVLYHEVNRELAAEAREAAADRRLAAWLFLSRRYGASEIASDPALREPFELLSVQVRRWASKTERRELVSEINAWSQAVRAASKGDKV